jgi:hypothetical protein
MDELRLGHGTPILVLAQTASTVTTGLSLGLVLGLLRLVAPAANSQTSASPAMRSRRHATAINSRPTLNLTSRSESLIIVASRQPPNAGL